NEEIRKNPAANSIPCFVVDAVVHAPKGAHPSQCYNYYDYDKDYFIAYDKASKTDEDFKAFVDEWVYGVKTHEEYLDKLGASRLINLINTPGLGYSENLNK
ncbi:MAG: glutaconate CoA-transferase, partial [Filifactor alocis]